MRGLLLRHRNIFSLISLLGILIIVKFIILHPRQEEIKVNLLKDSPHNNSRSVKSYVNPNLEPLIIPKNFCKRQFYLLIVVHSHPLSFEARSVIRQTWGNPKELYGQNGVVFLIGETSQSVTQKQIQREGEIYHDIIQERFVDSYANLSLKSVLMLKIISTCKNVKLMKADTDLYVNTRGILKLCRMRPVFSHNLLTGRYMARKKPIRNRHSKYYTPKHIYNKTFYPPFLAGTGYLMSMDVVETLYRAALTIPIFHLEDVYITGMCAKAAGVRHLKVNYFSNVGLPNDLCLFSKLFVMHSCTPEMIRSLYNIRMDLNKICLYLMEVRKTKRELAYRNKKKMKKLKKNYQAVNATRPF